LGVKTDFLNVIFMNDLLYVTEKHKVILNYLSANELKNKKILDVGSGRNKIGSVSIDIDKSHKPDFVVDVQKDKFPFKENEFDVIILSDVLEHLDYPEKALTECKRVLKKNGKMIITIPNSNNILFKLGIWNQAVKTGNEHKKFWGKKDFTEFLSKQGLRVSSFRSTYYFRGNNFLISLFPDRLAFCLFFVAEVV